MSRSGWRSYVSSRRSAQRKRQALPCTVSDLEVRTMLSVVGGLVADINQLDANPTNLTNVNGKLFFVTQDGSQGTVSLWETDGTHQGAVELASIAESGYGLPSDPASFVSLGGAVYFMSTDSSGGPGLFKSGRHDDRHRGGRTAF